MIDEFKVYKIIKAHPLKFGIKLNWHSCNGFTFGVQNQFHKSFHNKNHRRFNIAYFLYYIKGLMKFFIKSHQKSRANSQD